MTTTSTETPDVKVISNDKITEELNKFDNEYYKNVNRELKKVIHVTKPSSEKDAGSSESSSEAIVISDERNMMKSHIVWSITYESTSEKIIKIEKYPTPKDEKYNFKEALAQAVDIELGSEWKLRMANDSKKIEEVDLRKKKTADASENVKVKVTENVKDKVTENVEDKVAENVEDNVKNILLVGRTGDGKSTIANVLVNAVDENGKTKHYFKESDSGISETKKATIVLFDHEGKEYRVIDTMGIGDTEHDFEKVLEMIIQAIHQVDYKLDHILFITGGRMTKEVIDSFNLMKSVIFCDKDDEKGEFLLENYTTLVRTRFCGFNDQGECREDTHSMITESTAISIMINSCKGGTPIYVDNPPIYAELDQRLAEATEKGDNEKVKELKKKLDEIKVEKTTNKDKRDKSRKILLDGLDKSEKNRKNQKSFEATEMRNFGEKIIPLTNQKKILEEKEKKIDDKDDKTEVELKKAYTKKKEDLENDLRNKILEYTDERVEKEKGEVIVKNDGDDKKMSDQVTAGATAGAAGAALISIGAVFMNAFVPGLGSGLSQVVIKLINPK
ncbi:unnamed protein product [Rhizophagus irregularis]|uniref:AIG1-type G domain-containing protein n=1 Tax=Rhizophagus irregularis TaxID=588596 RepID=A0A2I1G6K2_9GLOM|nr:hypothetical protein RhiirA4_540288 [Rhizophagus irregularis]CAB4428679.1 unnamed protein product [Rhizophagus irregularis]CAB4428964.1 unnamed protein product [Rhizophagus irregularis]